MGFRVRLAGYLAGAPAAKGGRVTRGMGGQAGRGAGWMEPHRDAQEGGMQVGWPEEGAAGSKDGWENSKEVQAA